MKINAETFRQSSDHYVTPRVRDLMSSDVITLSEEDSLKALQEVLKWKAIRHVPITDTKGTLVGLVTQRDFLTVAVSKLAHLNPEDLDALYTGVKIKDIMGRKVTTIASNRPLTEAALVMYEHKYGCLPVVDDGRLVGIITEADFVKAFLEWDARFKTE